MNKEQRQFMKKFTFGLRYGTATVGDDVVTTASLEPVNRMLVKLSGKHYRACKHCGKEVLKVELIDGHCFHCMNMLGIDEDGEECEE